MPQMTTRRLRERECVCVCVSECVCVCVCVLRKYALILGWALNNTPGILFIHMHMWVIHACV
jgi:hypothetical protein